MKDEFKATKDFVKFLHQVYGLFLDGSRAFPLLREQIIEAQERIKKTDNIPIADLDRRVCFIGSGNPNNKKEALLYHIASQGEVKERNINDGRNLCFLGNMCLVWIYQLWEDKFRQQVAMEIGYNNKNQLELDIMGEIKKYRESIIHHKGQAKKEAVNNKILNWFKRDEIINIDKAKMKVIITATMNELKSLMKVEIIEKEKILIKDVILNPYGFRSVFDIN